MYAVELEMGTVIEGLTVYAVELEMGTVSEGLTVYAVELEMGTILFFCDDVALFP